MFKSKSLFVRHRSRIISLKRTVLLKDEQVTKIWLVLLSAELLWGNMYIIKLFSQFYLGLETIVIFFGANFQPGGTLFYTWHVVDACEIIEKWRHQTLHTHSVIGHH